MNELLPESSTPYRGFVLFSTLVFITVLGLFLAAYSQVSKVDLGMNSASLNSADSFFAAEAGLNLRAAAVRSKFLGYNRPDGTSPVELLPCQGGNVGSGDYECKTDNFGKKNVTTFIEEAPDNPAEIRIPVGERFQGLNAQEYRYTARSQATGTSGEIEAQLELTFRTRLVPLFQFAAFYNKDLEILPGPQMTLNGPVHTNIDLYMDTGATLTFQGQITSGAKMYRGRKNDTSCLSNTVRALNPATYLSLKPSCPSRSLLTKSYLGPWNGMVEQGIGSLEVPAPSSTDSVAGSLYWDRADIRLVLNLNGSKAPDYTNSVTAVEVRNPDNSLNATATSNLNACTSPSSNLPGQRVIGATSSFRNNRESSSATIQMLEVDMNNLLACLNSNAVAGTSLLANSNGIDDTTDGGLVLYFTVKGPNSAAAKSLYGIRVRNGKTLQISGAPRVRGVTVVSDQAVYVAGDYNSPANAADWVGAAFLTDAINILSNNWFNGTGDAKSTGALNGRVPTATTVQAAFMSGSDLTGGIDGTGQTGQYNGGLENFPRFHEAWTSSIPFNYTGSMVSLSKSFHNNGPWVYGGSQYTAPQRNWAYDTRFNLAEQLPPLTPRFVYLRQELFVRDFDREEP